ncbi:isochorismatase family protein [Zemynaea arenosa]|nr:isochorismatase family protein [Massilia arenosa]
MHIDPKTTAVVHIDLQRSNVARQLAPHSAQQVLDNCGKLADAFRHHGATIFHVHVLVHEIVPREADKSLRAPDAPPPPPDASELVEQTGPKHSDIVITKRQWGAFYGTDLELHLRRRNIKTLLMTGIATNFGVESTARIAYDQGYSLLFAEDAMTSFSAEVHDFAVRQIFPFMGHVRSTQEILAALGS